MLDTTKRTPSLFFTHKKLRHRVSVAFRHVCGQSVDEFLNLVVGRHDPLFLQVFRQELDFSIRDLRESMPGNRRSSNVARHISQEMPFRLDGVNVDVPPAFILRFQHHFQLFGARLRNKQSLISFAERDTIPLKTHAPQNAILIYTRKVHSSNL